MKPDTSGMKRQPGAYPHIQKTCERLDVEIKTNIAEKTCDGETNPVVSLGCRNDLAAGLLGCEVTPWCNSLQELEEFCRDHATEIEAASTSEELPYISK